MTVVVVQLVESIESADPPSTISTPLPSTLGGRIAAAALLSVVTVALTLATSALLLNAHEPMWLRLTVTTAAAVIVTAGWTLFFIDARRVHLLRSAERNWPDVRRRARASSGRVTTCTPVSDEGTVTGYRLAIETHDSSVTARFSAKGAVLTPRSGSLARLWQAERGDPILAEVVGTRQ